MIRNTYSADVIRRYLRSGATVRAEKLIDRLPLAHLSPLVRDLTPLEARGLFDILFHPDRVEHALKDLDRDDLGAILPLIDDARLVAALARLNGAGQARLMALLPPARRKQARLELQERASVFARGVRPVSTVMRPPALTLDHAMRVAQARERLEAFERLADPGASLEVFYVIDGADRLRGVIHRAILLEARDEERLEVLMDPCTRAVTSTWPVREAVEARDLGDLTTLPVVDEAGRLIGEVAVSRLLELVETAPGAEQRARAALPGWRKVLPWLTGSLVLAAGASWAWGMIHF